MAIPIRNRFRLQSVLLHRLEDGPLSYQQLIEGYKDPSIPEGAINDLISLGVVERRTSNSEATFRFTTYGRTQFQAQPEPSTAPPWPYIIVVGVVLFVLWLCLHSIL